MNNAICFRLRQLGTRALVLMLTGGCAALMPKPAPQPSFFSLDGARPIAATQRVVANGTPTLVVNPPLATAGFDSQRIIYVRDAHKLEYFAQSEWIDTPARMLAPLIVSATERSGAFRAVVSTPSAAAGDIRLETEIIRLQHNFGGPTSGVRFTLRAYLVDSATRRVLARREFDETVAATSEDPYGGVVAANRAVQIVLEQLAGFCTDAARKWTPPWIDESPRAKARMLER